MKPVLFSVRGGNPNVGLSPDLVLVYGDSPRDLIGGARDGPPVRSQPSRWEGVRGARKRLALKEPHEPPQERGPSIFFWGGAGRRLGIVSG